MKKETKRRIYIFSIYLVGMLLLPSLIYLLWSQFISVNAFQVNFIVYMMLFIAVAIPLYKVLKEQKKFDKQNIWMIFGFQILMYIANFIINYIIIFLTILATGVNNPDTLVSTNQHAVTNMALNSNIVLFSFMTVVLAPIIEELVFRYGIFKGIRNKHSFWLSAIISALLFGFIHVSKDLLTGNWLSFITIFSYASMGFFMCLIYEKTNDFKAPVFLHMLNNLISVIIIFMSSLAY